MNKLSLTGLVLTNLLCLVPACGDSGSDDTAGSTTAGTPATPATATEDQPTGDLPTSGTSADTGGADSELCTHLGGPEGIGALTDNFLGKVITDDRINAYFLTNKLDVGALRQCVVDQLGEATGCDGVVYGCKTMKASHEGLGISAQDFGDFAEDFVAAWTEHKTTYKDITDGDLDTVVGVLTSLAPDIVEDADNNLTVYQRVGRKPNIKALIGLPTAATSFVGVVAADATINGFFGATDFNRLNTCLTRQVQGLDGPSTYGFERDGLPDTVDPGASAASPCRDMISSHAALMDPNDALGIQAADFGALVGDLITAMTTAGVTSDDQNIILGALGPLCGDIVTVDPENCG